MIVTFGCPYFRRAFAWCVPIGALAGLIGLGGGEFRLPVLMHSIGFAAKSAVPVNLAVSLITLAFALAARSGTVSLVDVVPHAPEVVGLVCGGVAMAYHAPKLITSLTNERLIQIIAVLLAGIGVLLCIEAALPFSHTDLVPDSEVSRFLISVCLGAGIGLVSSLLGVAGGELIIPAFIFIFGADIRTAGTASILISLCLIVAGLWRHWQMGTFPKGRGVYRITSAMGMGSIIGAVIGGLLVGLAPVGALKLLLGAVLLGAAVKMLLEHKRRGT